MNILQINEYGPFGIESGIAVCGSSKIYINDFNSFYNFNDFNPTVEYLDEEISGMLYRNKIGCNDISLDSLRFSFKNKPRFVAEINSDAIPLNLMHPYNYFHFLIESLPSFFYLIQSGLIKEGSMIVSGKMHQNFRAAYNLITNDRFNIMELNLNDAIKADRILKAKDAFFLNELISKKFPNNIYIDAQRLNQFRQFFTNKLVNIKKNNSDSRLFILRNSTQRNILNLDEVLDVASSAGFKVVDPSQLSFCEQVNLFSEATCVAGPTGAWMANLIFLNTNAKVAILSPETCLSKISIGKALAKVLGFYLSDYYFQTPVINKFQPIHSDFFVDKNILNNLLADLTNHCL